MDELGKSIPAAEGMVEAEANVKSKTPNEFCLNCGTKLQDIYCHHCGQKDIPRRQTLGELWINFISSFWSFEGKFFRTTKFLIIRPGFLAVEYNNGKRESYYHPARMYVFISFVFFLAFFSLSEEDSTIELTEEDKKEMAADAEKLKNPNIDSLINAIPGQDSTLKKAISGPWMDSVKKKVKEKKGKKSNFSFEKSKYKTKEAYDSAQQLLPGDKRDGWFAHRVIYRTIELNNKYGDDKSAFGKDFVGAFKDNFSKVLFYLLPIFALILKLLYIRRGQFYSEHLVFTIYYYNFFYFAGSIQMLTSWLKIPWVSTIIGFWIFFYLLFAMKRMYAQGWGKTILKFFLFSWTFLIVASLAFMINAFFIIFLI